MGRTLSARVMNAVGRRIAEGVYEAGDVLPPEAELCAEFGVSRTSLREAMTRLIAKGLIVVGPKSGTRVLPTTRWNQLDVDLLRWRLEVGMKDEIVEQLYELRFAFEPDASRLAALHGSDEDHAAITAALAEMDRLRDDSVRLVEPDIAFHMAIVAATRNVFMISVAAAVRTALTYQFQVGEAHRVFPASAFDAGEFALHGRIGRAILARRGDAAAGLMRELIRASRQSLVRAMERSRADAVGERSPVSTAT